MYSIRLIFRIFFIFITINLVFGQEKNVWSQLKSPCNEVNIVAEQMPEFPGGIVSFKHYINSNLELPDEVLEYGIIGKYFVSFVLDSDGYIIKQSIDRVYAPSSSCDSIVTKVLTDSPRWEPGFSKAYNCPVKVKITIPITIDYRKADKSNWLKYYIKSSNKYLNKKRYKPAITYLASAIVLDSSNAELYYKRALIYTQKKRKKKACDDFVKAQQLGKLDIPIENFTRCK